MPLKRTLTLKQILEEPVPEVKWEVERFIAQGDRVVMFGEFGAGKSFLAHSMAVALAHGLPWLGQYATTARRVLFLDEEMSEQETRRRLRRIAGGLGVNLNTVNSNLLIASHSIGEFNSPALGHLRTVFREWDPEVIFVDSLRRVLPGDENRAQDISAFWRSMESIWNAGQRTMVFLHHMNKPPMEGMREARHRASGSTDILAGADAGIAVGYLHTPDEAPYRRATIEGVKARSTKEKSQFTVQWNVVEDDGPLVIQIVQTSKGGPDPTLWSGATGTTCK